MIKIGLLGFGNVGQGVLDILKKNARHITERVGDEIQIEKILVRDINKYSGLIQDTAQLTTHPEDIISNAEIDIVVEMMGGEFPAYDYICDALKNRKHVVTANKEVISRHKETLFKLAKEHSVDIYFEAAVGGGIPIIRSLKVGLAANKIKKIYGILNGTTNYILTKIEEEKATFEEVLQKAQSLGFAEADPTMDVEGIDVAHKLVILTAVAFKSKVQLEDLYVEGITNVSLTDIMYAKELGFTIKLLAIGELLSNDSLSLKVHPTLIPSGHFLSSVKNEFNAAYIVGNAVGEVLLAGKGAGGSPTGSAVVSDIIDIAFDLTGALNRRNLEAHLVERPRQSLNESESGFYLRLLLDDKPHMMETVTKIMSDADINIKKLLQKESINDKAEVVILTNTIKENHIQNVSQNLQQTKGVSLESMIRVDHLNAF